MSILQCEYEVDRAAIKFTDKEHLKASERAEASFLKALFNQRIAKTKPQDDIEMKDSDEGEAKSEDQEVDDDLF